MNKTLGGMEKKTTLVWMFMYQSFWVDNDPSGNGWRCEKGYEKRGVKH